MLVVFLKCSLVFVFIDTAWCQICKPEFKSNLSDSLVLSYEMRRLDVDEMSLSLVDNQPFINMFSDSCNQTVKSLRLDYRPVGDAVWNEYSGRRGDIHTGRTALVIKNIDPCLEYEVQIVAISEDDSEHRAPHIHFGPFYKELSKEEQELLTSESMPDISASITYSNVSSSGFTVSWGKICAQSVNVFLLKGPDFEYEEPYEVLTNLLENGKEWNRDNSLWIAANPCEEYKVAVETFMTQEPVPVDKELDASRDQEAKSTVFTDPEMGQLVSASMEEESHYLKWVFAQQMSCISNFSYEIQLTGETEGDIPQANGDWQEKSGSLDLSVNTYKECSNYQLEMKIQYETKTAHAFRETVLSRYLRSNQVGRFAEEGTNDFHVHNDVIHVTFDSCNKEAFLLLTAEDDPVMNVTVNADTPNVLVKDFETVVENCVEYKINLQDHDRIYGVEEFPIKPPKKEAAIYMIDFTTSSLAFEVLGTEENKKCKVDKYTVTCRSMDKMKQNQGSGFEDSEYDGINLIGEGSGTLDNDTQNIEEETIEVEFIGVSTNSSKIKIENLTPKTSYKCKGSIHYQDVEVSSETVAEETEGFDGLEITEDGNITVTCNSRLQNLSLALVSLNGYIVKVVEANCFENDHVDMFNSETEECLVYTIELYESKALEEFIANYKYNNQSLLPPAIALAPHPKVREPDMIPELQFISSHNHSLSFNVNTNLTHHCKVKFYCVTCSNGNQTRGVHHSMEPQIVVEGLERDDTYVCSTHVEVEGEGQSENLWTRYSPSIEVNTEGFDEMEILENGHVEVTCGSNVKELNIVLVEGDGKKIGVKEASCNGSTCIHGLMKSMKPCGKYKIQLIARQEYDDLQEQGQWEDGEITSFDDVDLDVKDPEGQPMLVLAASHPYSVEFKIEDEINDFCEKENIEIDCESNSNDTYVKILKAPTSDEVAVASTITISGLSPEHSYSCSAIVQYSMATLNQSIQITNETALYNPKSSPLTVQTTKGVHLEEVLTVKSSSNIIWYIVIGVGVMFGIVVGIICRRRRSASKDLVETTNQNVVQQKDNVIATLDVEVEK